MHVGTELEVPNEVNPGGACKRDEHISPRDRFAPMHAWRIFFLGLTCIHLSLPRE